MSDWKERPDVKVLAESVLAVDGIFDFANIPAGFQHLLVEASLRSANPGAARDYVEMNLNGDFGANYQEFLVEFFSPVGATVVQANAAATTRIRSGLVRQNGAAAGFDPYSARIPGYASAAVHAMQSDTGSREAALRMRGFGYGEYSVAAVINRVQIRAHDGALAQNFLAGSVATLFGLR